jgi:DNA primase
MNIPEQTLLNELNKLLRKKLSKKISGEGEDDVPEVTPIAEKQTEEIEVDEAEFQEKDIIRLLLNFGNKEMDVQATNEENEKITKKVSIATFIVNDIINDEFAFNNKNYQLIFDVFVEAISQDSLPNDQYFMHHADENIRNTAINLISSPYSLSENWQKMHRIFVPTEDETHILEASVNHSVFSFKLKKIEAMLASNAKEIKELNNDEDIIILMEKQKRLLNIKKMISSALGRIIIR